MPRGYPDTVTCPECREGQPADMAYCPECGGDLHKALSKKKHFYCVAGVECFDYDNQTRRPISESTQELNGKHLCRHCYNVGFRLKMDVIAKRSK